MTPDIAACLLEAGSCIAVLPEASRPQRATVHRIIATMMHRLSPDMLGDGWHDAFDGAILSLDHLGGDAAIVHRLLRPSRAALCRGPADISTPRRAQAKSSYCYACGSA